WRLPRRCRPLRPTTTWSFRPTAFCSGPSTRARTMRWPARLFNHRTSGSGLRRLCERPNINEPLGRKRSSLPWHNALSSGDTRSPDSVARDRQRVLLGGQNFLANLQQLREALKSEAGTHDVDSVANLATIKDLLLSDEVLVVHVPVLRSLGKVCIRADRILSSVQAVDDTAVPDARLLVAPLTATHAASNEADSQFPAVEAVRMGKLLFGGLEDCVRSSR